MRDDIPGVIHGKTIELLDDPGMKQGQRISVAIKAEPENRVWGEGILASAGALSHLPQEVFDELDEIVRQRKNERPRDIPG